MKKCGSKSGCGKSPMLPSSSGSVKGAQRSNEPSHFEKMYQKDAAQIRSQKIKK